MQTQNTNQRAIRGYSILAKGDVPKPISKEEFLIPSQNGNGRYKVIHKQEWTCECPDFKYRQKCCKHIHAVQFWLKMRNKVEVDDLESANDLLNEKVCIYCKSQNIVKDGKRKTKSGEKQRYLCRDCKKRFVYEAIKGTKANSKIITLTMDLYFKGLSLRDISDTIYQFYNIKLHHETIRRWIRKFTKAMNEYTEKIKPELSDFWHADEQMVKVKGKWLWNWNVLDGETRFLIANNITKGRSVPETREVFKKAKQSVSNRPDFIVTDGLKAYPRALRKELKTHTTKRKTRPQHIRLRTIQEKPNNNLVERYHNEFREFDKVRRGFKAEGTAQEWNDGFRVYHNYIKKHMGLSGLTPSQVAGIELELGRNRWLGLLMKSLNQTV